MTAWHLCLIVCTSVETEPCKPTSQQLVEPQLSPYPLKTPTTTLSLNALQRKLEERLSSNGVGADPYLQKIVNATRKAFTDRDLLYDKNQELTKQNNKKIR